MENEKNKLSESAVNQTVSNEMPEESKFIPEPVNDTNTVSQVVASTPALEKNENQPTEAPASQKPVAPESTPVNPQPETQQVAPQPPVAQTASNQEGTPVMEAQQIAPAQTETTGFEDIKPKKKNKGILIVLLLLILAAAGVGIFFVYKNYFSGSKVTFLNAVNNSYKQFSEFVDQISQNDMTRLMSNNTTLVDANLKLTTSLDPSITDEETAQLLNEINKLDFSIGYGIDLINKRAEMNLKANYDNGSLFEFLMILKEQKQYLLLKDIFEKYLEIPMEDIKEFNEIFEISDNQSKEALHTIEVIKNAFVNALDQNDFKEENATITIQGESISTKKISYEINQSNASKIMTKILEDLKKDNRAITFLAKNSSMTKEQYIADIDQQLLDLKETKKTNNKIIITTYIMNDKCVELTIHMDETDITNQTTKSMIDYKSYKDTTEIHLTQNDITLLNLEVKQISEQKMELILDMDAIKGNAVLTQENDETSGTFELQIKDANVKLSGEFTNKETIVTKDKHYKEEIDMNLKLNANNVSLATIRMQINGDVKFGETIANVDTTNSVLIDSLTEEDSIKIQENLMKNETILKFIKALEPIFKQPDLDL